MIDHPHPRPSRGTRLSTLLLVAACQGRDGVLTEATPDPPSTDTSGTSTAPTTGLTTSTATDDTGMGNGGTGMAGSSSTANMTEGTGAGTTGGDIDLAADCQAVFDAMDACDLSHRHQRARPG